MSNFSAEERERYARHILLKEIGGPGQQKLKRATVALVGAGGLGAPAALYLAAAGVGRLRLIDDDAVSLSNLQRQVLYRSDDVGASKVERGAEALKALNANVTIDPCTERLTGANAEALLSGADVVLDGCDSFATRFAVNAACHALGIALISGAVGRWDGQLATFKSGVTKHLPADERLPCYRCFVAEEPPGGETCAEVGVVGALTGVIGAMMALEAIKEIAQTGESLAGRLMLYDGLSSQSRIVKLPRDPACPVCGDHNLRHGLIMDTAHIDVDEELFEMANLEPEKTGVDGFVYVSTAVARHGPRVKYFRKLGKGQPSFSVSIADEPAVLVTSLSQTDTDRYAPQVIEFVRRNRQKLLDFWENGTEWPSDKVHTFLNSFDKIS